MAEEQGEREAEDGSTLETGQMRVEGCLVTPKERIRSTSVARLREEAPKLVEKVKESLYDNKLLKGLQSSGDSEEDAAMKQAAGTIVMISLTADVIDLPASEIEALVDFCADNTERVEGIVDREGDPRAWKRMEEGERREWFDLHVSHSALMGYFLGLYMKKSGLGSASTG